LLLLVGVVGCAGMACRREGQGRAAPGPIQPPLYRLEGKVLKPEGTDNAGILLFLGGTSHLAYTDDQGRYTLADVPPGKYKVWAQHSDYRSALIADLALDATTSSPANPILLPEKKLEPKETPAQLAERDFCSVMGQVLLKGEPASDGIVVRAVGTDFRTVTDPRGNYSLLRLDPGMYTLVFEKAGYREDRRAIQLKKGDLIFPDPIVLEPLAEKTAGRVISGTVTLLDPKGKPMNDYTGILVYLEGTTNVALPGSTGNFRFEGLVPARYAVAAVGPSFLGTSRAEADVTQAMEANVVLTLKSFEQGTSEPGTLVGRVLKDDPKDPLMGTVVGLVELGATAMTDAKGAYVFSDVTPGTYTLVAQVEGYNPGSLEEVVVPEGDTATATDLILQKKREYPKVLFTIPADGTRDLVVRELIPVTVRFSKKMNPASLRAAFSIEPKVDYRLYTGRENPQSDYDRLYVELMGVGPASALHFNSDYAVTLSTAAADDENLHLEQPYRFTFRTGRASVVGTRPADGQREVYLDPAFYRLGIFFNAPLDPRSVTPDRIRIRPATTSLPQISLIASPMSGWSEVSVSASWEKGVRYTVTVNAGIRTRDGSSISNLPYTFSFTTSPARPMVVTPRPGGMRRGP
jgi:hypothetical protein